MKKLLGLFVFIWSAAPAFALKETFKAGKFGNVTVIGTERKEAPALTIILVGDGGMDVRFERMMESLTKVDSVFVVVETLKYLENIKKSKEACHYSAADFESLSHLVQEKYRFTKYVTPTLVGYSSGATLAYGALAQAPANTFRGAISFGFCPDLAIDKPLCKGDGLMMSKLTKGKLKGNYWLEPYAKLKQPWYVLDGTTDMVCNIDKQKKYVANLPNTHLIALKGVGHLFGVRKVWLPEYQKAFDALKEPVSFAAIDASLQDLPLIELNSDKNDTLVVILSGDGGWASLDKEIAGAFQGKGYAVVGLDSLKYFWQKKTPDNIAQDLSRIARYYLGAWKKKKIIWLGYSMGADVLPFGLSRLEESLKRATAGAVYLGLSKSAEFEFHFTNWLTSSDSSSGLPISPEIKKISTLKNICVRGLDESSSGCDELEAPVKTIKVDGGHHFNGEYEKLAKLLIEAL